MLDRSWAISSSPQRRRREEEAEESVIVADHWLNKMRERERGEGKREKQEEMIG